MQKQIMQELHYFYQARRIVCGFVKQSTPKI